jgi:hypothetical protein
MNNQSFVLYESVFKQMERLEKKLGAEEAYNFIKAIATFGLYGALPEEDDSVWLYGFEQSITSISAAKTRYEAAVENGKKGGRPKEIDEEMVIWRHEEGDSNAAIAAMMKCSVSSVEKILAKYRKGLEEPEEPTESNFSDFTGKEDIVVIKKKKKEKKFYNLDNM